jgi:ArsR family transcriptional regulator
MNDLVALFKALGDETRLRILLLLRVRPLCVCEISETLEIAFSTLSAHLKILKGCGLVTDEKDGRWVIYRLSEGKPLLHRLLRAVESEITDDPRFLRDRATVSRISREMCSLMMRERGGRS